MVQSDRSSRHEPYGSFRSEQVAAGEPLQRRRDRTADGAVAHATRIRVRQMRAGVVKPGGEFTLTGQLTIAGGMRLEGGARCVVTIGERVYVAPGGTNIGIVIADDEPIIRLDLKKMLEGLSYEEIGRIQGVPANTAAGRYRYGLEKLRGCVTEENDHESHRLGTDDGAMDPPAALRADWAQALRPGTAGGGHGGPRDRAGRGCLPRRRRALPERCQKPPRGGPAGLGYGPRAQPAGHQPLLAAGRGRGLRRPRGRRARREAEGDARSVVEREPPLTSRQHCKRLVAGRFAPEHVPNRLGARPTRGQPRSRG